MDVVLILKWNKLSQYDWSFSGTEGQYFTGWFGSKTEYLITYSPQKSLEIYLKYTQGIYTICKQRVCDDIRVSIR